jgi:hypothetical protein
MLRPESRTGDEDMDELPIATSDSEADTDMNVIDTDRTFSNAAGPEDDATQMPMNFTDEDFTALFSVKHFDLSSSTTLDLFDQFTTVNAQSDDISAVCGSSSANADLQTMFQNGIDNLDFTEFWETFNPMVSENSQPSPQEEDVELRLADFMGMENTHLMHGDVDHGKLADEMQSLLSGYLV